MRRAFALATLAYLVPTFILGYTWHLVFFADVYHQLGIYRPDVIVPFGFGSMLLQGTLFAAAYLRLSAEPWRVGVAARFGLAAALLSWSFTTLAVAAKHPMTSVTTFVAIETAFTLIQFALAAPLLALSARTLRAGVRFSADTSAASPS